MIPKSELRVIGSVLRTHGIHGEMNVIMDMPEVDPSDLPCVFFDIEGLRVPFFVKSVRSRGAESILLTLDDIDSDTKADEFCGKDVFAKTSDIKEIYGEEESDEDGFYLADMIGYSVVADGNELGIIEDFDDSTANVLMLIKEASSGRIVHIPVADEFFQSIDPDEQKVILELPEGLLNLNN